MKKTWVIFLFCIALIKVYSQNISIDIENDNVFDNKEYFNQYNDDRTYFFSQMFLRANIQFNSNHHVNIGGYQKLQYGKLNDNRPSFLLNYSYSDSIWNAYFGRFNYNHAEKIPISYIAQEYYYHRPLAEGIYLKRTIPKSTSTLFIDWTGKQYDTVREAFHIFFREQYSIKSLYFDYSFILSHLAHPLIRNEPTHIRDNIATRFMIGYNFNYADAQIDAKIGILQSFDRLRTIYTWRKPRSFIGEINSEYNDFHVDILFHSGKGHFIQHGDPFYNAPYYVQSDIYYKLDINKIKIQGGIAFHFIDNVVDLSQEISVSVDLNDIRFSNDNH